MRDKEMMILQISHAQEKILRMKLSILKRDAIIERFTQRAIEFFEPSIEEAKKFKKFISKPLKFDKGIN